MFPTLHQIYRQKSLIRITPHNKDSKFHPLFSFIENVLNDPYFIENVFDSNTLDTSSDAFSKIKTLRAECATELLEEMLIGILLGIVDSTILYTLACACLAISVKLIGAHDWVYDGRIFPSLIAEAEAYGETVDKRKLNLMEKDILARTGWKGCSSITDLDKFYDELFLPQKSFELVASDKWYLLSDDGVRYDNTMPLDAVNPKIKVNERIIKEISLSKKISIDKAREWIKARVLGYGFDLGDVNLIEIVDAEHLSLILDDQWYIVTSLGDRLDTETFAGLGIKSATVTADPKALRSTMVGRKLSRERALDWIKNRVLMYGFELEEVIVK